MKTGFCLSGGGGRGAFQVGALEWIAEHNKCQPFQVGAGTSVGAVNALGLAMHGGDLERAVPFLIDAWGRLATTGDVWRWRWPPVFAGAFNTSIGDNDPLRRLLLELVDFDAVMNGPNVVVTAWDLLSGEAARWNLREATSKEELVRFILASSSFPIAFPPEVLRGGLYTDGGVSEVSPVRAAVGLGAERVLALVCQAPLDRRPASEFKTVADVGARVFAGMSEEIVSNDLQITGLKNALVEMGHPNVKGKRQVALDIIRPSESLGDPLDFSAEATARRRKIGREAARRYFLG